MMSHCHDGSCHIHTAAEGLSPDAQFLLFWLAILAGVAIVGAVAAWAEHREDMKALARVRARKAAGLDPVAGWDSWNRHG